ncbi:MAG: type II secretion system protein [Planctomycetota bacterium]|jgi:general secretion pathway protein G
MRAKSGFTLVEILIVVVILGILAAIVIPQFTEASSEAKESRLMSDLQSVRSQIELYKIQHNDEVPGAGTASFTDSLIMYTDVAGALAVVQAPGAGVYGPYLQKIPTNPWNDFDSVRIDGAAAGANTDGWRFDSTTSDFRADDNLLCSDDVTPHSDL